MRAMVIHTRLGLKKKDLPVILSFQYPGAATTASWEVWPGGRDSSTQPGLSKKEPWGPVPAKPPGRGTRGFLWGFTMSSASVSFIFRKLRALGVGGLGDGGAALSAVSL